MLLVRQVRQACTHGAATAARQIAPVAEAALFPMATAFTPVPAFAHPHASVPGRPQDGGDDGPAADAEPDAPGQERFARPVRPQRVLRPFVALMATTGVIGTGEARGVGR